MRNCSKESTKNDLTHSRQSLLTSGLIVAALTFASFFLFFIRDIYLARTYGVNEQLDAFFIAFLVPMLAVNVLSTPMGSAFIPIYQHTKANKNQDAEQYVAYISKATFTVASALAIALIIITPFVLSLLGYKLPANLFAGLESCMFFVPVLIFLLSGQVILANSILNSHHKNHIPAIAQLIVPFTAIVTIFTFGNHYSITVVLFAMLIGQFLNYVFVRSALKKINIHLSLGFTHKINFKALSFNGLYLPLVATAFFTAIAPTISTLFTLQLPHGNLSAFNLGTKITLFITGLLSTLVSSLLLPYFSNLIANQKSESAKEELAFFINSSNYLALPFCLILFIYSNDMAHIIFGTGNISESELSLVERVIQYTVIQIPFYLSGLILLKFFIASRQVKFIFLIGIFSLLINIGVTNLLLKYMGINAVAIGYTISVIFSALVISILSCIYKYVELNIVLNLMLIWLLFICILTNLHFNNVIGIYLTGLLSCILFINNYQEYLFARLKKLLTASVH